MSFFHTLVFRAREAAGWCTLAFSTQYLFGPLFWWRYATVKTLHGWKFSGEHFSSLFMLKNIPLFILWSSALGDVMVLAADLGASVADGQDTSKTAHFESCLLPLLQANGVVAMVFFACVTMICHNMQCQVQEICMISSPSSNILAPPLLLFLLNQSLMNSWETWHLQRGQGWNFPCNLLDLCGNRSDIELMGNVVPHPCDTCLWKRKNNCLLRRILQW